MKAATREERIRYLINQYYTGTASPAEADELRSILQEGADKDVIVAELEALAMTAPEAVHITEERLDTVFQSIVSSRTRQLPVRRYWYGAAAAAVLACIVAGSLYFFTTKEPAAPAQVAAVTEIAPGHEGAVLTLANGQQVVLDNQADGAIAAGTEQGISKRGGELIVDGQHTVNTALNTLSTPRGRQFTLNLPDGSKVWLNAASAIKFPAAFTGEERVVYLSGEGYFEVAAKKDAAGEKIPFKVVVNQKSTIEVLGTHFNINAYEDEESIRTTLLEGAVKVSTSASTVVLQPGQQATINTDHIAVEQHADTEQAVSWKNGLFIFNGRSDLPEVMRQLSRWYDVEVVFAGKVPEIAFTGEMQRNLSLQQVTKGLAAMGVNFKIEGRKFIIYP
ncbi:FecR family protein [Chitinophaga rhizophila]|uniref:DUF4974 domain-containing protein n=1 Tax=Chitinophaga rhizophila TaxID=2866212 RepID=A0ABS7GDQ9_9BACT|nr:FecR family protein [Chitinophaga rhizophila]MBW8684797.1 DUF4974 domain-containing protein [Chitinophaga rhizophila]